MNESEMAARQWIMSKYNLGTEQVVKNPRTPDFSTPVGGFEIKTVAQNRIVFTSSQLPAFDEDPDITVLVFDNEHLTMEIPGSSIKQRVNTVNKLNIHYYDSSSVVSFRLSPAVLKEIDKVCKKFGWSRAEFFQNNVNVLLSYWQQTLDGKEVDLPPYKSNL